MENDLIVIKSNQILEVFSSNEGLDIYVEQAREIVNGFEHNLETDAGRKKTASLANKVAKLKVKLDALGKDLVSEWKTKAKAVDINRKSMRDSLDELKADARKPLTDWEDEQAKIEADRIAKEGEEKRMAQVESDHEIAILMDEKITREATEAYEAAECELIAKEEEMKRQAAESARIEAEKKAQDAIEKAATEKAEAEAAAKESDRLRIAAEERAKIEAEQSEQRRIDAKKKAIEDSEQAAESARLAQIEAQKEAARKETEALEKREANKRHVGKIRKAAKESIMELGHSEEKAKELVMAIHESRIANVRILY